MALALWTLLGLAATCRGARPTAEENKVIASSDNGASVTATGHFVLRNDAHSGVWLTAELKCKVQRKGECCECSEKKRLAEERDQNCCHRRGIRYLWTRSCEVCECCPSEEESRRESYQMMQGHRDVNKDAWKYGDHVEGFGADKNTAVAHPGELANPSLHLSPTLDYGWEAPDNAGVYEPPPLAKGQKKYRVQNLGNWSDQEGIPYYTSPDFDDALKDPKRMAHWDQLLAGKDLGDFIEADINTIAGRAPVIRYVPKMIPEKLDPPEPEHKVLFEEEEKKETEDIAHVAQEEAEDTMSDLPPELREALAAERAGGRKFDKKQLRERLLDHFIGSEQAGLTNADWPGAAHYFQQFDNYYNKGFKDLSAPFMSHAKDLTDKAVLTYEKLKGVDAVRGSTDDVLKDVQAKTDNTFLVVNKESRDVANRAVKAFDSLKKFEAESGGADAIDKYYKDAAMLSEEQLIQAGHHHKDTGKFDFWQNDDDFMADPKVNLEELDAPNKHYLFNDQISESAAGSGNAPSHDAEVIDEEQDEQLPGDSPQQDPNERQLMPPHGAVNGAINEDGSDPFLQKKDGDIPQDVSSSQRE